MLKLGAINKNSDLKLSILLVIEVCFKINPSYWIISSYRQHLLPVYIIIQGCLSISTSPCLQPGTAAPSTMTSHCGHPLWCHSSVTARVICCTQDTAHLRGSFSSSYCYTSTLRQYTISCCGYEELDCIFSVHAALLPNSQQMGKLSVTNP